MKVSRTIQSLVDRANELAFPHQTEEDTYSNYITLSISISVDREFQCHFDIWHSDDGYTNYQSNDSYLVDYVQDETLVGALNQLDNILTEAEGDLSQDYSIDTDELATPSIFVGDKEYRLVKQDN